MFRSDRNRLSYFSFKTGGKNFTSRILESKFYESTGIFNKMYRISKHHFEKPMTLISCISLHLISKILKFYFITSQDDFGSLEAELL